MVIAPSVAMLRPIAPSPAGRILSADRERPPGQPLGGLETAEAAVDACDRIEKIRLDVRLRGKLGVQALAGLIQQRARRKVAAGLVGIGDLEEADQELFDGVGPARGGGGDAGVGLGAGTLAGRGDEPSHEGNGDERSGGRRSRRLRRTNLPAR